MAEGSATGEEVKLGPGIGLGGNWVLGGVKRDSSLKSSFLVGSFSELAGLDLDWGFF
jgi:hypothetical protein